MKQRSLIGLTWCLAVAMPAFGSERAMQIASAACDPRQRTVQIEGRNLARDGMQPALQVEGHARPLQATHISDGRIVARLPEGLGDGQYVITIRKGANVAEWREVAVVLGVVGPAIVE